MLFEFLSIFPLRTVTNSQSLSILLSYPSAGSGLLVFLTWKMEIRNDREINYETLFFELSYLNMVITDGTQECEQQIYCTLINVT